MPQDWRPRSAHRMSDTEWNATVTRVRGEFDEMPSLRVTPEQARILFGLRDPASDWVLGRLTEEGFLARTPQGEYVRKSTAP